MNSTVRVVGIDLGTTNSVVAFVDEAGEAHAIAGRDGERIVPSVVWFPRDDETRVEVGDLGKSQAVIDPEHVAMLFKRGMGKATFLDSRKPFVIRGKEWRPEELSSLVLKKMVQIASDHLGYQVTDVVITVPAYFGEAERSATRQAGEMIGLTVHALPAEPMAAAIAHGLDGNARARMFLVFDLGGGTFDVTILKRHDDGQLEAISHHGDRRLGGADFDRLIVARMASSPCGSHGVILDADPGRSRRGHRQGRAAQEGAEQPGTCPGRSHRRRQADDVRARPGPSSPGCYRSTWRAQSWPWRPAWTTRNCGPPIWTRC